MHPGSAFGNMRKRASLPAGVGHKRPFATGRFGPAHPRLRHGLTTGCWGSHRARRRHSGRRWVNSRDPGIPLLHPGRLENRPKTSIQTECKNTVETSTTGIAGGSAAARAERSRTPIGWSRFWSELLARHRADLVNQLRRRFRSSDTVRPPQRRAVRALTAREVQILNGVAADQPPPTITITGTRFPGAPLTLPLVTAQTRRPQTVPVPRNQVQFKQYCYPMRMVFSIDIWAHESPLDSKGNPLLATTGYILQGSTTSGVTIGYGIDLGMSGSSKQAIATQLTTWGISSAGLQTLRPYLGLTGAPASAAIQQYGAPTISTIDAKTISKNAVTSYSDQAASQFGKLYADATFEQLPGNAQTALTDLVYWTWTLTSPNLPAGFANAITNNDFLTAGQLLINTGQKRLVDDGRWLQTAAGRLPKPSQDVCCGCGP